MEINNENKSGLDQDKLKLLKYELAKYCIDTAKKPLIFGSESPLDLCDALCLDANTDTIEQKMELLKHGETIGFGIYPGLGLPPFIDIETGRPQWQFTEEKIVGVLINTHAVNRNEVPCYMDCAIIETEHCVISTLDFNKEYREMCFGRPNMDRTIADLLRTCDLSDFSKEYQMCFGRHNLDQAIVDLSSAWGRAFENGVPTQAKLSTLKEALAVMCDANGIVPMCAKPLINDAHIQNLGVVKYDDFGFGNHCFADGFADIKPGDRIQLECCDQVKNIPSHATAPEGRDVFIDVAAIQFVDNGTFAILDVNGNLYVSPNLDFSEEITRLRIDIAGQHLESVKLEMGEQHIFDNADIVGFEDGPEIGD